MLSRTHSLFTQSDPSFNLYCLDSSFIAVFHLLLVHTAALSSVILTPSLYQLYLNLPSFFTFHSFIPASLLSSLFLYMQHIYILIYLFAYSSPFIHSYLLLFSPLLSDSSYIYAYILNSSRVWQNPKITIKNQNKN